jgi:ribosomal protein S18 acetylase RimI-like enzyme
MRETSQPNPARIPEHPGRTRSSLLPPWKVQLLAASPPTCTEIRAGAKEIYIYDLAVAEMHRRQGIATAMIAEPENRSYAAYDSFSRLR